MKKHKFYTFLIIGVLLLNAFFGWKAYRTEMLFDAMRPWLALLAAVLFPGILLGLVSCFRKPKLKRLAEEKPDGIICTGINLLYCVLAEMSLFLALCGIAIGAANRRDTGALACGLFIAVLGMLLTAAVCLYLWNRMAVIDANGILFINAFGKEYAYTKEEIVSIAQVNYYAYNNGGFTARRNLAIKSTGGTIWLNSSMTNYNEAVELTETNYADRFRAG